MKYYPSVSCGTKAFFVPVDAVKDIDLLTAPQLRVLLIALESGECGCTSKDIAEKLKISVSDAEDILEYWVKRNILSCDGNASKACEEPVKTCLCPPEIKPTMEEIERYQGDKDIKFVLDESQRILGITFTTADTSTIVWLIKWAGVSPEVLVTIIQYCAANKKINLRYIQKTALEWLDLGIDTIEKAEERIKFLDTVGTWEGEIKKILGIGGRNLTTKEKEYSENWRLMEIPFELIETAYERSIDNTGKMSFAYINKILVSWKQKGIDTAKKAKEEKKQSPSSASSPSFDISELEKRMMLDDDVI